MERNIVVQLTQVRKMSEGNLQFFKLLYQRTESPNVAAMYRPTSPLPLSIIPQKQAPSPSPPVLVGKERATSKLQGCMSFYTSRIPS